MFDDLVLHFLLGGFLPDILSEFIKVVNNDADNGWITIFGKLKNELPEISNELNDIFDLFSNEDISNWTNNDLVDFVDGIKGADDSFKKFLSTADVSGDLMEQYQQYLSNASSANAKFASSLKSIGANMAIMLAVNVAVKATANSPICLIKITCPHIT